MEELDSTDFIYIDNLNLDLYDMIKNKPYENEVKTFKSKDELRREIKNRIQKVCEITELSDYASCKLLIESKWCIDKALELFNENKCFDEDQLYIEVNHNNIFFCDICMQNETIMAKLSCPHQICKNCFRKYLDTKLNVNISSTTIECPYADCKLMTCIKKVYVDLVNEKTIQENPEILDDSFIYVNPYVKKCPKCKILIQVEIIKGAYTGGYEILCNNCSYNFCSCCYSEWHPMINCKLLEKYKTVTLTQHEYPILTRNSINEEMLDWLKSKTKMCPNCKEVIEKNKGCNYMKCSKCQHKFCWECLVTYDRYGEHKCDSKSKDSQEFQKKQETFYAFLDKNNVKVSQPELLKSLNSISLNVDRYYFHSLQLEKESIEINYFEQNCFKKIKKILKNCRNLLRYSYIFSMCLETLDNATLFEMQRMLLEIKTQELANQLDKNRPEIYIEELKNICEKLLYNIIEIVNEGYEKNYWIFKS